MPEKTTTVGELKSFLKTVPAETEITFGSSTFSKRPLVFYRCKRRGEDLLGIEVSELDSDPDNPCAEIDERITAGKLLSHLSTWKDSDRITFGNTIDASPLVLRNISTVVSFNLEQPVFGGYSFID